MLIALIIIIILLILFFISTQNKLVKFRNEVKSAESNMGVFMKRRADLIPNLVNSVKGYAKHEETILTKVTELRSAVSNETASFEERVKANDELSKTINQIQVVSERYPDLKANEQFRYLNEELSNAENKIAFSRTGYNAVVTDYNNLVESFPSSVIANMTGFRTAEYLQITEADKEVPKVEF